MKEILYSNEPKRLDLILDSWLDELGGERATIADCLAQEPVWSLEAEPLLRTAQQLFELDLAPLPSPSVEAIRSRMLSRCEDARASRRTASRWLIWVRLSAASAVILLLVMAALIGAWRVSADSLPGSSVYPIKRAFEDLRVALTRSPAERATLYTTYALGRVDEAMKSGEQQAGLSETTLQAASQQLILANEAIAQAEKEGVRIPWDRLSGLSSAGEQELAKSGFSSQAAIQARESLRLLYQRAQRQIGVDAGADESRPTETAPTEGTGVPTEAQGQGPVRLQPSPVSTVRPAPSEEPPTDRPVIQPTMGRNVQRTSPATISSPVSETPAAKAGPTRPGGTRAAPTVPPTGQPMPTPAASATTRQGEAPPETAAPPGGPSAGGGGPAGGQSGSGGGSGGGGNGGSKGGGGKGR